METVRVWLSFVCASCKERKDDKELHPLVNGNWVCEACVPNYRPCNDCGLYMKGSEPFCADCK